MTSRTAAILLSIPLSILLAAPVALADQPLRVNGKPIPPDRMELARKAAIAAGSADTPELRAAIRSQLVAREVLRQAATRKGYDKDPAVLAARDDAMIRRYLVETAKPAPVAEAEVRARYDAIVGSLGDREFKTGIIAVRDARLAEELLAAARRGDDFAVLARRHSVLPSAAAGGALGWVSFKLPAGEGRTQGLPVPVANALGALTPGAMTPAPIQADGLHYIARVDDARPTRIPGYGDVAPTLRKTLETLAQERAAAVLTAKLLETATVTP